MVTSFLLILIISRMMHAHHLYSPPPWSQLDVLWLIYPWLETKWAEHIWAFLLLVRPRPPQLPLWTPSLRRTPYHPAMKSEFWDRIFDFGQISFRIFGHFFQWAKFHYITVWLLWFWIMNNKWSKITVGCTCISLLYKQILLIFLGQLGTLWKFSRLWTIRF